MSLDDFIIGTQLGKGSFGSVFIVTRKQDNKQYAMKSVNINNLKDKEKLSSLNEIRILSSLNHQNIIGYKEAFFDSKTKTLNIIMEYAEEGDLRKKIKENLKKHLHFTEDTIWDWIIQILEGLKYLHDNKIMHRDLKSANIFISKNGILKLGDLNVSIITKMGMAKTRTGTPYYCSPEIWKDLPYDYKSDIWSVGCIIYELCMLKPPFRGTNLKKLYQNVISGNYMPIIYYYSDDIRNIVSKMLVVDPAKRVTVDELLMSDILKKRILKARQNIITKEVKMGQKSRKVNFMETIKLPRNFKEINSKLPKKKYKVEKEMMDNDEYETMKATFFQEFQNTMKKNNLNLMNNNFFGDENGNYKNKDNNENIMINRQLVNNNINNNINNNLVRNNNNEYLNKNIYNCKQNNNIYDFANKINSKAKNEYEERKVVNENRENRKYINNYIISNDYLNNKNYDKINQYRKPEENNYNNNIYKYNETDKINISSNKRNNQIKISENNLNIINNKYNQNNKVQAYNYNNKYMNNNINNIDKNYNINKNYNYYQNKDNNLDLNEINDKYQKENDRNRKVKNIDNNINEEVNINNILKNNNNDKRVNQINNKNNYYEYKSNLNYKIKANAKVKNKVKQKNEKIEHEIDGDNNEYNEYNDVKLNDKPQYNIKDNELFKINIPQKNEKNKLNNNGIIYSERNSKKYNQQSNYISNNKKEDYNRINYIYNQNQILHNNKRFITPDNIRKSRANNNSNNMYNNYSYVCRKVTNNDNSQNKRVLKEKLRKIPNSKYSNDNIRLNNNYRRNNGNYGEYINVQNNHVQHNIYYSKNKKNNNGDNNNIYNNNIYNNNIGNNNSYKNYQINNKIEYNSNYRNIYRSNINNNVSNNNIFISNNNNYKYNFIPKNNIYESVQNNNYRRNNINNNKMNDINNYKFEFKYQFRRPINKVGVTYEKINYNEYYKRNNMGVGGQIYNNYNLNNNDYLKYNNIISSQNKNGDKYLMKLQNDNYNKNNFLYY